MIQQKILIIPSWVSDRVSLRDINKPEKLLSTLSRIDVDNYVCINLAFLGVVTPIHNDSFFKTRDDALPLELYSELFEDKDLEQTLSEIIHNFTINKHTYGKLLLDQNVIIDEIDFDVKVIDNETIGLIPKVKTECQTHPIELIDVISKYCSTEELFKTNIVRYYLYTL